MNKRSLLLVLSGYVIWGLLPLYWGLLGKLSPMFVLANRILWSAAFTFLLLWAAGRRKALLAIFLDGAMMKYLVPAAIVITINWGLFIWAVSAGRMLDASLGYFINPLAVFVCGAVVFKERLGGTEWAALTLAAAGVLLCTLQAGEFPLVALMLAASFSTYATLKKFAHVDALLSVCVETLLVAPPALLFVVLSPATGASLSAASALEIVLLFCSGFVTALPLVLYSQGFNHLSLTTMGLLQFVLPTLMFFTSILKGEDALSRLGGFALIWAGLTVFAVGLIRRERRAKPHGKETAENAG